METVTNCWTCRETKPVFTRMGYDEMSVCKDCYEHFNGKIRQCAECSSPILGEEVDEGAIMCQECEEHYYEEVQDEQCY